MSAIMIPALKSTLLLSFFSPGYKAFLVSFIIARFHISMKVDMRFYVLAANRRISAIIYDSLNSQRDVVLALKRFSDVARGQ